MTKPGKIIEPPHCNIRDHERQTAKVIANAGLTVEFISASNKDLSKSPDIMIDGRRWEMKSPKTNKMSQVEKNLRRASKQAENIIIDSQRIKHIPDKKIQDFLKERLKIRKSIKRIVFVNKRRKIVDITSSY